MSLLTAVAVSGCTATPSENLADFDHAYKQGKQARASMIGHGQAVTDKSCAAMYDSTDVRLGYSEWKDHSGNDGYWATLKTSYVNGCMNRPNTHGSPTGSTAPSAPASSRR